MNRLLVPHDFSRDATRALLYAIGLAKDATVDVLHVASEDLLACEAELEDVLATIAIPAHRRVNLRCELGDAGPRIVQIAQEEAYDLIVLGAHGQTRDSRVRLGKVAEYVAFHAPCGVLAVQGGPLAVTPWLPRNSATTNRVDSTQLRFSCPVTEEKKSLNACLTCARFKAACVTLGEHELEIICQK